MDCDSKRKENVKMNTISKKVTNVIICIAAISLLGGCVSQKKYNALNVEKENLKGLLEREQTEKGQLAGQLAQEQQTIEELQKKLAQRQSVGQASGFGDKYDVAFDADAGTVTVKLQNEILFDPGKAALKRSASGDLNHILEVLKSQYSGRQVDIVGHTDSDPIKKSQWKDNWQLSTERALTVVRYMIDHGIAKERIRAVGRGDSKPVVPNTSASNKAKNRRVEIVVHMK